MPSTELDLSARVEAMGRSAVYALLSLALAYPNEERARALREQIRPLLADADTGDEKLNAALARMLAELDRPLAPLRTAFIDLFTHTASPDCPTHETAYSERDVFRQAHEMADLAGFYRAWGFDIGGSERERPDHVGPQLEFMSVLGRKEVLALDRGDTAAADESRRTQRLFLQDHLGCWGESLGGRVAGLSPDPYYQAAGNLLAAWLAFDLEHLGVTPARRLDEPLPLPPPETDDGCGVPDGCAAQVTNESFVGLSEIR